MKPIAATTMTMIKVGDVVRHIHDIQRDIVCVGLVDRIDDTTDQVRIVWASSVAQTLPSHMRWYHKHLIVKIS